MSVHIVTSPTVPIPVPGDDTAALGPLAHTGRMEASSSSPDPARSPTPDMRTDFVRSPSPDATSTLAQNAGSPRRSPSPYGMVSSQAGSQSTREEDSDEGMLILDEGDSGSEQSDERVVLPLSSTGADLSPVPSGLPSRRGSITAGSAVGGTGESITNKDATDLKGSSNEPVSFAVSNLSGDILIGRTPAAKSVVKGESPKVPKCGVPPKLQKCAGASQFQRLRSMLVINGDMQKGKLCGAYEVGLQVAKCKRTAHGTARRRNSTMDDTDCTSSQWSQSEDAFDINESALLAETETQEVKPQEQPCIVGSGATPVVVGAHDEEPPCFLPVWAKHLSSLEEPYRVPYMHPKKGKVLVDLVKRFPEILSEVQGTAFFEKEKIVQAPSTPLPSNLQAPLAFNGFGAMWGKNKDMIVSRENLTASLNIPQCKAKSKIAPVVARVLQFPEDENDEASVVVPSPVSSPVPSPRRLIHISEQESLVYASVYVGDEEFLLREDRVAPNSDTPAQPADSQPPASQPASSVMSDLRMSSEVKFRPSQLHISGAGIRAQNPLSLPIVPPLQESEVLPVFRSRLLAELDIDNKEQMPDQEEEIQKQNSDQEPEPELVPEDEALSSGSSNTQGEDQDAQTSRRLSPNLLQNLDYCLSSIDDSLPAPTAPLAALDALRAGHLPRLPAWAANRHTLPNSPKDGSVTLGGPTFRRLCTTPKAEMTPRTIQPHPSLECTENSVFSQVGNPNPDAIPDANAEEQPTIPLETAHGAGFEPVEAGKVAQRSVAPLVARPPSACRSSNWRRGNGVSTTRARVPDLTASPVLCVQGMGQVEAEIGGKPKTQARVLVTSATAGPPSSRPISKKSMRPNSGEIRKKPAIFEQQSIKATPQRLLHELVEISAKQHTAQSDKKASPCDQDHEEGASSPSAPTGRPQSAATPLSGAHFEFKSQSTNVEIQPARAKSATGPRPWCGRPPPRPSSRQSGEVEHAGFSDLAGNRHAGEGTATEAPGPSKRFPGMRQLNLAIGEQSDCYETL